MRPSVKQIACRKIAAVVAGLLLLAVTTPLRATEATLHLQLGHESSIESLDVSPDGRFILTTSFGKDACLWDVATARELRRFVGHADGVLTVAFSKNGLLAVTASSDKTARLWDVATGKQVLSLVGHTGRIWSAAFSYDGRFVITGSDDGSARIWNVATGQSVAVLPPHAADPADARGWIRAVAFSRDGQRVLTAGWDGIVRIWNPATREQLREFASEGSPSAGSNRIQTAAFSPDGQLVAAAGFGNVIYLWDVATGREVRRLTGHTKRIGSLAFSMDGRSLATGSDDETARVWDLNSGREVQVIRAGLRVPAVAFAPDAKTLVTGGLGKLWDIASGKTVSQLKQLATPVHALTLSDDGRLLVIGNVEPAIWDLTLGRERYRLAGDFREVEAEALSPGGRFLLTGNQDGTARLWDLRTGKDVRRLKGHKDQVRSVALAFDDKLAITGGDDQTARIWDLDSGKETHRFETPGHWVGGVAFSPDRRNVILLEHPNVATIISRDANSTASRIRVLDLQTGTELRRMTSPYMSNWVVSADGRWIVTVGDGYVVEIWEAASGKRIAQFRSELADQSNPSQSTTAVALSKDNRIILAGHGDGSVSVFDLHDHKEGLLRMHAFDVTAISISPDAKKSVTASSDGSVRIWDLSLQSLQAVLVSFWTPSFSLLEWAVTDPNGRYDSSDPDGVPGLYFVAGNDVIELGQLKQRFYTPGLLTKLWRGDPLPDVDARLHQITIPPSVEVELPKPGSQNAVLRLANRGGGIGKVYVKVNGRELPSSTRGQALDANAKSAELQLDLSGATFAANGQNVIEVAVENGDGLIRSRGVIVPWERQSATTVTPELFAVVVGISQYESPNMNLRYSAKDAVDFGNALTVASNRLFGADHTHVTILATGGPLDPTKSGIKQAFDAVAKQAHPNDLLVVYLAGHGSASREQHDQYLYFTREARNVQVDRDDSLRELTAISSTELKAWLGRQNMPLKQVVVLDTCAAGAAFGEMVKLADRRELSPDQIRAIELLKDSTGSWILMGSAADAVSYEANRYAQGLVTYALLEGMKGAALDSDRVEVSRLFGFAQQRVEDLARGIGGVQRPIISAPKGQTFPIGMLTAEDRTKIHLAIVKPQVLRARVLDEDDLDALKLEPALRAELRSVSMPATRGSERQDPPIAYLDSVIDDVPDALIPQVRYVVAGDRVRIRLRLLQNGKVVSERNLEVEKSDATHISQVTVNEIITLSKTIH